jgi:hypothetical protein
MVYIGDNPPELLLGERLFKKPIKVEPLSSRDKLANESRVNYSKLYTVEHNVKVCFIGKIHDDSYQTFFADVMNTFFEEGT